MTDRIVLAGIEVYAHGGVSAAEKEIGQRYRVDVTLELDLTRPSKTDALEDTINYGLVHAAVVETLREREFNLLENAAGRIADRLINEYPVGRAAVRLEKLLPPIDGVVASAAVEIARERSTLPVTSRSPGQLPRR
jgi:7,8-dihydroneopterin aldolase/epimerase/oxygenase